MRKMMIFEVFLTLIPLDLACQVYNCASCPISISICIACNVGYYLISSTYCGCTPPCSTCSSTDPTNCITCVDPTYQSPPGCACSSLTMETGYDYHCRQCHHGCAVCSTFFDCSSCNDGYYLSGTSCPDCYGPCKTCINQKDYCITCWDPTNQLPPPTCLCKDNLHYFAYSTCPLCVSPCLTCTSKNECLSCVSTAYLLQGTSCPACTLPCATCSGTLTNCTTCHDPTNQNAPSCTCSSNTRYLNTSTFYCDLCISPCATCSSATACLSCVSNAYLLQGTTCTQCTGPCATCSTALTYCTTCLDPSNQSSPPTCQCLSNNNYFDTSSRKCELCLSPCATCSSATDCSSCVSNQYLLVGTTCVSCTRPCVYCLTTPTNCISCLDSINQSPPTCGCSSNTKYLNTSTNYCDPCVTPCLTCSSQTSCLSCVSTYYLSGTNCVSCVSPCATCSSSSSCSSCISTLYYLVGTTCTLCTKPCVDCSTSLTTCTSCFDATNQNTPNCGCSSTTRYLNPTTKLCDPCISPCLTCTSSTACLSCVSTLYHLEGTTCVLCTKPCATCLTSLTDCSTCLDAPNQVAPTCECSPKTKYMDLSTKNCIPCVSPCATCTTAAICLSCVSKDYYLTGTSCIQCTRPCQTCETSLTDCITCQYPTLQAPPTCGCIHLDKYYDSTWNNCVPCVSPCATCTSLILCLTCVDPKHEAINNVCVCKQGYLLQLGTTTCIRCQEPCKTCVNTIFQCTSCVSSYFYEQNQCIQCSPQCKSCVNKPDNCLECSDLNHFFYKNDCFCRPGYYESTQMTCIECEPPCATCQYNYDYCTTCLSDIQVILDNKCVCEDGYYMNSDDCQACQSNCTKCLAYDHCTECKVDYYLYNDLCDNYCDDPCQTCTIPIYCLSCIQGYYLESSGNCLKCMDNCKQCQEYDVCEFCDDGHLITNYMCLKCNENCQTCIDTADKCDSCQLNEQLIENKCYCDSTPTDTCISCEYPCLLCSNQQCEKCATIDKLYLSIENQCVCEENYQWQENKCQFQCSQLCQLCQDGVCQQCQDNYELNNNECILIQLCGNGYLDDQEYCDDGNKVPNDGCYQCKIEDGWNCNSDQPSSCTYYEAPVMILTYLNQTSLLQYVSLQFTQQIRISSNQNLSENINLEVVGTESNLSFIQIFPITEASTELSSVNYQFSIEIDQLLADKPQFSVQLNQEIVNEYDIPLTQTNKSIYLNIPKYLSPEQKAKAELAQNTNQNVIYGLGTISLISLLTGESAIFQEILKMLQYQSYLKYINLDYPENLEIFFQSTNIVSVSAIIKYTNLNYYLTKYSLKQGPLTTDGKFAVYSYDADLITNLACQFIQLIGLVTVAFITKSLQRKFYSRKVIVEYIYWVNRPNRKTSPKLMLTIQKTIYTIIQSVFNVGKQFSKAGLRSLFLINSQDLIFKALIYLHYMQFDSIRNYVQATFAVVIVGSYLLLIFYTISHNNNLLFNVKKEELIQIRYDIINLSRQTAFLASIVFLQSNQILQTVLISLVNFSYFVTVKRKKAMLKQFNVIQQIIEVMILLFTITSFLYFDDLSKYFTDELKILIGWIQIGFLILSLLGEASKFVIAKSQSLIKYIQDKMKESEQKKRFDPMKQFYLIEM